MTASGPIMAADLKNLQGRLIGVSAWHRLAQQQITRFAELTGDLQFIHTDPQRAAAETGYGGTIAHGFLTLALLPKMAAEAIPPLAGSRLAINYGFDRIRFIAPVAAGSRVRGRFSLLRLEERKLGELTLTLAVEVEREAEDKPAIYAEWISRRIIGETQPVTGAPE